MSTEGADRQQQELTSFARLLLVSGTGTALPTAVTLAGPLLRATGATLTASAGLIGVFSGLLISHETATQALPVRRCVCGRPSSRIAFAGSNHILYRAIRTPASGAFGATPVTRAISSFACAASSAISWCHNCAAWDSISR